MKKLTSDEKYMKGAMAKRREFLESTGQDQAQYMFDNQYPHKVRRVGPETRTRKRARKRGKSR